MQPTVVSRRHGLLLRLGSSIPPQNFSESDGAGLGFELEFDRLVNFAGQLRVVRGLGSTRFSSSSSCAHSTSLLLYS